MADALNAEAFTFGHDIYFGAGKRRSRTKEADRLLAHELAHVVRQSHTAPTLQRKLKITGKADHVSPTIALLNASVGSSCYVSSDKSGEVKIEPIRAAHTSSATRSERVVSQRERWAAQRRQRPVAAGQTCACRQREMSIVDVQAGVASRAQAQRCDGAAAGGRRLLRDRVVARS